MSKKIKYRFDPFLKELIFNSLASVDRKAFDSKVMSLTLELEDGAEFSFIFDKIKYVCWFFTPDIVFIEHIKRYPSKG